MHKDVYFIDSLFIAFSPFIRLIIVWRLIFSLMQNNSFAKISLKLKEKPLER